MTEVDYFLSRIKHEALNMNAYIAHLENIESWFFNLAQKQAFYLPKITEGVNYRFERLDVALPDADLSRFNSFDLESIRKNNSLDLFSYQPSILPPGKKIFPDGEILFTFATDDKGHYHFSHEHHTEQQILSGVRACDLKGIYLLDKAFSEGTKDVHYLQRREATDIIAFNCLAPCDEHCFCEAAQSLDFQTGADIFITPLFSNNKEHNHKEQENKEQKNTEICLLEVLTTRGETLIQTLLSEPCENPHEIKEQALGLRPKPFGRQFVEPAENVSKNIHDNDAGPVYQKYAEKCFSCGTCNLVCPTCYCFETKDELDLGGISGKSSGKKTRHWDACMNPGFSEVTGGHNFRSEPADRQRHRVRRKFDYLPQRFEQIFCTGCGRCGRQCTTGIDIFDIVNDVCLFVADEQESVDE